MEIRAEKPEDVATIRQVNIAAFERENEANLVDKLRKVTSTFSFVAVQDDSVVAHIFFSPVSFVGKCSRDVFLLGLAPLAVLPKYQRQGIGSLLVQYTLKECDRAGCNAVVVLGHPAYYPRFGFIPAREKGLGCEYSVPDEAFMVLELSHEALKDCSGIVKYRPEFMSV
ncbi:GNAT family N-acetyltransferase [Merismopedia glauca]|uniref:GNAT family N-acetyltransferase n=1 Tax=Merismopedia glauca CCAP 1448/3 TaxID=1296344 RepID=A0A2T1BZI7_9CYAN|nr:N-acetyltransferase [Merismopedia glauca]PSB01440.1 GNAT family N-acetyltransferase [Merismopedia glauca CCAP 1448/3]